MSEYRYYEFLAVDRPLTAQDMAQLREVSTRARITPSSFVNEYSWGSLKAKPRELMRSFFDVHVYLASWGDAVLMMRLPREALDGEALEPFAAGSALEIVTLPGHWLLIWSLGDTESYSGYVEGEGWMTRLAPLREELLRGDLRSLYLGWLQAVMLEEVDESEGTPALPAGLGELTAAQQALVDFLDIDDDLLAGAAARSPKIAADEACQADSDAWLARLPKDEALGYLRQLLAGQGVQAERALRRRHAAWRSADSTGPKLEPLAVSALRGLAEQAKEARLAEEAMARVQAETERVRNRHTFLVALAGDFPKGWSAAHAEAGKGTALGYDAACRQLVNLRDAYALRADVGGFQEEFLRFKGVHGRRRALMERLSNEGLKV